MLTSEESMTIAAKEVLTLRSVSNDDAIVTVNLQESSRGFWVACAVRMRVAPPGMVVEEVRCWAASHCSSQALSEAVGYALFEDASAVSCVSTDGPIFAIAKALELNSLGC